MADIDENNKKWIEENEKLMLEGNDILDKAVEEAIDYLQDAIENMGDKQWRKMVMGTQIVEMGIGVAFAEHLMPTIYNPMQKNMHKKLKIKKETAVALQHIFVGRVIKNIIRSYNARDTK
jgi:hypothetical protein